MLLISNPLKKFLKNAQKVMSKKSLDKSGKIAHFRHVFAKNFFWYIFLKLFQRIFSKLWMQMRTRRLKKTGNLFFINVSRNHQWLATKLL